MFGGKKKDDDFDDNDLFVFARHKPGELEHLCKETKFTKKEIRLIYQGFKQECPTGICTEDEFVQIFSKFFPQGDASRYAHYVFYNFKQVNSGMLNFEQFLNVLSSLSRGTLNEKLHWIFNLYDIDGDGFISKNEMQIIVSAIYDMLGNYAVPLADPSTAKDHVEKIFHLIDTNKDGMISFEEFSDWCQKDQDRAQSLLIFDTVFL